MTPRTKVFLTSNVFSKDEIGSSNKISEKIKNEISKLWSELENISNLKVFEGRFPSKKQIEDIVSNFKPNILGCHLSHQISEKVLNTKSLVAISTCTAGFNHINRTEDDDVIITHTPGVLHKTVADYTIAVIMANLRNLIDLNSYVWKGNWTSDDKWDLDQNLSSVISKKKIGIIGLGEIGKQVIKNLYQWNVELYYYDHHRKLNFEKAYPRIHFQKNMEDLFKVSDIISLHVPLNDQTRHFINEKHLRLMKNNSLLVNTARGAIIDFKDLLNLLENQEIQIDLSFDVFPEEPIPDNILKRFKNIKNKQPNRRFVLLPHNASADANTRGRMNILFLKDIIKIIKARNLKDIEEIHLISEHREDLENKRWRILEFWNTGS